MERKELLDLLVKNKLTLSAMESLTGGLFAASFTSIPGASQVFKGAGVTYVDEVKESFGVKKDTINEFGAVSLQCAKEMCLKASSFFNTDCAVSFTGNAGPTASENKPVGLVFIAIKVKTHLYSYKLSLTGDREEIRKQCVDFAFSTLIEKIKGLLENNPTSAI
ncbi:MAG: CinA family protein [Bacilli bacterium]|jgi:PncC family amidohydrolase